MYLGTLLVVLQCAPLYWTYEYRSVQIVNGKTIPVIIEVDDVTGNTKVRPVDAAPPPPSPPPPKSQPRTTEVQGTKVVNGRTVPVTFIVNLDTGETTEKQMNSNPSPTLQKQRSFDDDFAAVKTMPIGTQVNFGAGARSSTQTQPKFGTTKTQPQPRAGTFQPTLGSTQTQTVSPSKAQSTDEDAAIKAMMEKYKNSEYGKFSTAVANKELDIGGFEKLLGGFSGAGGGDEASKTSDYYKKVNEGGGIAALFGGGDDAENAATDEAENKPPSTLLKISSAIEIPLTEEKGDLFATILVGTPKDGSKPQVLKTLLDTGSFHTWVVSSEYTGDHQCQKTDGQKSLTYSTKRIKAEQSFVSGSVKGFWSRDNIVLGSTRKNIPVPNQQYAEAKEILDPHLLNNFDAIYGLSIVDKEVLPKEPSGNLANIAKHYGKVPLFGIFMNKENKGGSKLVFAENHNYLIEGEFKSYPVQPNIPKNGKKYISGWHIKFDGFSVQHKGKAAQFIDPPEDTLAFPDSGTTTLTGPTEYVEKLYNAVFSNLEFKIPGPNYEFDCNKMPELVTTLPPINVVLGGTNYPILAQHYLGKMGDTCKGFILGVNNCKDILLGRTFMSTYYTVYDYSNKLVHIGKAKQPSMEAMRML